MYRAIYGAIYASIYNDPGGPSCRAHWLPTVDDEVIGSMRLRETSQGRLRIQGSSIRDGVTGDGMGEDLKIYPPIMATSENCYRYLQ